MKRLVYLRSRTRWKFCIALQTTVLALPTFAQRSFSNTLMPQPVKLSTQTGSLVITGKLRISLEGADDPLLERAARRMIFRLERQTALQLDQSFEDQGNPSIRVRVADHAIQRPAVGVDESYTLDVRDGAATLQASTDFGALHGMETLLQLVEQEPKGYVLPAVHIEDAPRFPWRGLLLDPGRHFLPVPNVLRTLDAMAAVKMNVLHWHLTEDQGFRIESKRFPKLQELGSAGQYYTQDEVRQVVAYATDRGIRVVPEFDMPGHSTTWLIGYPELASKPGPYHVERTNGIKDAAMDPTHESTYRFLDSFIEEMTSLFPDEYIHIGGDESNGKDWLDNPEIVRMMQQHNMKKTSELQAYFNARVQTMLLKHHRRMVGWDEILRPDLSSDVVVQNWHGIEFLVDAARQGHRGILSKPFYLDHNYSAADMYAADPIPSDDKLTPAQEQLILGGEACMWGEQVDSFTADSRIWPRAASVAERLWSPASIRDPQDMYRRLAVMSLRLDGLGVTHVSNPELGFRQIAGGNASALELFASVVQPVDMGQRSKEQHTSPLTPMTNVVDFTIFDPPSGRVFAQQVAAYLQSSRALEGRQHAAARALLEQTFNSWNAAASQLSLQTATNRRLASIAERQSQWFKLATLGLKSMAVIESRHRPSDKWILSQQTLLKSCAQSQELMDFVVLAPLGDLVKATSRASTN